MLRLKSCTIEVDRHDDEMVYEVHWANPLQNTNLFKGYNTNSQKITYRMDGGIQLLLVRQVNALYICLAKLAKSFKIW